MRTCEACLGVVEGRRGAEKIELLCRRDPSGTVEVELRLLAWGEGIGWYTQKTLPLAPDQLGALRALLRRAERQARPRGGGPPAAQIVPFPRPTAEAAC